MTEALYSDDAYLHQCDATVTAATSDGIRLDRTVFYAMGGGQPGDSGVLRFANGSEIAIVDTRRDAAGDIVHIPAQGEVLPAAGTPVEAMINWDRRYRHMRIHTCLHLLSAVIDAPVTGGSIAADKGRLDFDVAALDKAHVTGELNRLIQENHPVTTRWITDAELDAQPELVKTLSVAPPRGRGRVRLLAIGEGVDLQPCGGTHVRATAEIGPVRVSKIEKKSRLNRRVVVVFDE